MEYKNPTYTSDGRIDCEINHPKFGWIPFTADSNDSEEFGKQLFALISSKGGIASYSEPAISDETKAALIRAKRDVLLKECDWTQLTDVSVEIKTKWAPYRQALRDVPQQSGFPHNVVWPTV